MKTNKKFEKLLEAIDERQYVGLGNPDSKILFIGKEAGIESSSENHHGSYKYWKDKKQDYSETFIPKLDDKKLRDFRHTWQKYQRLYENILIGLGLNSQRTKEDKYEINFLENVFTTELSNLHALTSKKAVKLENFKEELETRKKVFFNSDFIKQFQIIVIFSSDKNYIETFPGEVCDLFDVKFVGLHDENAKDKIWIHSENVDSENRRLLLHTRQLTNSASKELITSISHLIVNFVKVNSLTLD